MLCICLIVIRRLYGYADADVDVDACEVRCICEGGELLAHEDGHKPWKGELFSLIQVNKSGQVVPKWFERGFKRCGAIGMPNTLVWVHVFKDYVICRIVWWEIGGMLVVCAWGGCRGS